MVARPHPRGAFPGGRGLAGKLGPEVRGLDGLRGGAGGAARLEHGGRGRRPGSRSVRARPGEPPIGQRFTAAASAAGLARRVTAHSGRVGLASELTARGASTTAVMLAGNWKTARMVAHYSAGATAERGAVATYL